MNRTRFTDEQIADMVARRRKGGKGNTYGAIALSYGCVAQTVRHHCLRAGIKSAKRPLAGFPAVTSRKGVEVRRFLPDEDAQLLRMLGEQVPPSQMARTLGRRNGAIANRLVALKAFGETP